MNDHQLNTANYNEHIFKKIDLYAKALKIYGFDYAVISSGGPDYRFRDDLSVPYFASAYFKEFLYLPECANSFLIIRPGKKPSLHLQKHDDFWHSEPSPLAEELYEQFDVSEYVSELSIEIGGKAVFIGPNTKFLAEKSQENIDINPEAFLAYIDFHRAWKTTYEIDCMRIANIHAARAHQIAEQYFQEGHCEYDIHMAYLRALNYCDRELPYDNIVALNEHAAVLHHTQLNKNKPAELHSFLIDAGAEYRGYAADITRTYTSETQDHIFARLIKAVNAMHLNIIDHIAPGQSYVDLHLMTHKMLAEILTEFELINVTADEAIERQITSAFFPHGLGHLIGVQVHDKGGHFADETGSENRPPDAHPFLRLTRKIENNMAFTIEPGLYFIPKLLKAWRGKGVLNEALIDALLPFGGIRIEDDIVMQNGKPVNLTREAFSAG